MAAYAPKILVASGTGIVLSSMLVGANAALSYIALPVVLLPNPTPKTQQPATGSGHLARQWQAIYNIGKKIGPGAAVPSAAAFTYASRLVPKGATLPRNLFIAAAVCNLLIVPFTFIFMKRTNDDLHRRANNATAGRDEVSAKKDAMQGSVESLETSDLIHHWGDLSTMRASLPLTAIGLGVAALLT